jgi:hypothetical protein
MDRRAMAIHRGKSLDAGRESAVIGADRQRQVVGADLGTAQEKPAIHQRPGAAFETAVSQNQAARLRAVRIRMSRWRTPNC